MIEMIRTFFGRVRGQHRDKQTVVVQGNLWRCTECKMVFVTEVAAKSHPCVGKT